jgi:predicted glycoside hydrolase/deacetylase ChbG (UPF0249 family)
VAGATSLVIVADDGGVDVARNLGIEAACSRGFVRAVSVMANGEAVEDVARRLAGQDVDAGLHLNLTEGTAVSGPLAGLTDAHGNFVHGKRELWALAHDEGIDPALVRREAAAQLGRLRTLGVRPVFVNGHQHVHVLPGVCEGLAAALGDFPEVRHVRCAPVAVCGPEPDAEFPHLPRERLAESASSLSEAGFDAEATFMTCSERAGPLIADGRRGVDVFVGLDLVLRPDREALLARLAAGLAAAPAGGVVEVMTHPGDRDAASVPYSGLPGREYERDMLCDAAFARAASAGFRLTRFSELS